MAPHSAAFSHSDRMPSGLRLYTRAVHSSQDILARASPLDDTTTDKEAILRYERAAQRFLSGQVPYLLTAALKGPFDKASGWVNPWDSTVCSESQPTTQQLTPNVRPETQAATGCPSTVLSTPCENPSSHLPKSACHLPSPESLVNHPFLKLDVVTRVQAWRDSVPTTKPPAREEFWVTSSRGASKRRSVDGSWLKKREGKRFRISEAESESPCLSVGTYGAAASSKPVAPEASRSMPSSSSSAAVNASSRNSSATRRQSAEVSVPPTSSETRQSCARSTQPVATDSPQATGGNMLSLQLSNLSTISSKKDLSKGSTPRIRSTRVAPRTISSLRPETTGTQTIASPNTIPGQQSSQVSSRAPADVTRSDENTPPSVSESNGDGSVMARAGLPPDLHRCPPGLTATSLVPQTDSCQSLADQDSKQTIEHMGLAASTPGNVVMHPKASKADSCQSLADHGARPTVESMDLTTSAPNDTGEASAAPGDLESGLGVADHEVSSSAPSSRASSASSSSDSSEPQHADISADTSLEEHFINIPKKSEMVLETQPELSSSSPRASLSEFTSAAANGSPVSSNLDENQPHNPIPPLASPRNTNLDRPSPPTAGCTRKNPESIHVPDHEASRPDHENASCAVAMVSPIPASIESESEALVPIRSQNHELLTVSPSESRLRHEVGDVTASSHGCAESPGGRLATQDQTPWENRTVDQIVETPIGEQTPCALQPTMGNSQAKTQDATQSPWAKEDEFIPQLSSPIAIAPVFSPRLPPSAAEVFVNEELERAIQGHAALPSDASNTSFSLPSFSTFMTPPRKRQAITALRFDGRLPETPSLLEAAAENPWGSNRRPKKRVSWARLPHEGDTATVGSSPSPCPSRFTPSSPPPAAPIPDGYEDVEDAFKNHFARVKRRTNPVRQRLLPPASQQYQSSQSIDAMAQAFMAADGVLTPAHPAHSINGEEAREEEMTAVQTGEEDPVDDVEAVLGNLDQFINPWEIEKDLEQSRASSGLSGKQSDVGVNGAVSGSKIGGLR